jgi:enoyl-CoA hydratase
MSGETRDRDLIIAREKGVVTVTFDRPDKLNALTGEMLASLEENMKALGRDDEVKVIVIQGAGRSFCSGADFDWVADNYLDESAHADRREIMWIATMLFNAIWECPKPTVLKVQGHCVGVGCYFLGFCDLVIAGESARLGSPESRSFGIEPSLGLWPFTIGPRWTKALLYTGDLVDGRTAERIGMVNHTLPDDELDDYVGWLAKRISRVDAHLLTLHKQSVNMMFEIMGFYPMLKAGVFFDHMEHMSPDWTEFLSRMRAEGVPAALRWQKEKLGDAVEDPDRDKLSDPRGERRR